MKQERVAGRFVRQGLDGDGGAAAQEKKTVAAAPRPKFCRTFTRARVAEALPEIVERFVEEAKKGSVAHAKMLTSLSGLGGPGKEIPQTKKRRGKSTVRLLIEKLKQEPGK